MDETAAYYQEVVQDFSEEFRMNYSLTGVLGRGTTALVVRAIQNRLRREVVIKILTSREVEVRQRFLVEAEALGRLRHPNVARLLDFGECGERLYLVMEYLPGRSLAAMLASGPLEPGTALDVALDVTAGLEAIHALDIIHRDLKPSNIWITDENRAKILDFGLARQGQGQGITQEGYFLGTYAFAAPEQIMGHVVDHRADLYTLGVLMFVLFDGSNPFKVEALSEALQRHLRVPPEDLPRTRPGPPHPAMAVALQLLAKEAGNRPGSAREVAARLRAIKDVQAAPTAGRGLRLEPGNVTAPRARPVPRRPGRAVAIGVISVTAILATGTLAWMRRGDGPGPEVTEITASSTVEPGRHLPAARVLMTSIVENCREREEYKFRIAGTLGPLGTEMNSGATVEIVVTAVKDHRRIGEFLQDEVEDELSTGSAEGAVIAAVLRCERSSSFSDLGGMKELMIIPREDSVPRDPDFQFFLRNVPVKQGTEALYLLKQAFGAVRAALDPVGASSPAPPWFERLVISVFDAGRRTISYGWTTDAVPRRDHEIALFEEALSPGSAPRPGDASRRLLLLSWRLSRQVQLSSEAERIRADLHRVLDGLVASSFLDRPRAAVIVERLGK